MEQFLDLFVKHFSGWVIAGILSGIGLMFTWVKNGFKEIKEQNQALINITRSQSRLSIQRYCEDYVNRNYAPLHVKDTVSNLFENYKALGGNGTIEVEFNKFMDLSTTPPKKKSTRKKQ